MNIEYSTLVMNWINFAIIIAIVVGIISGVRKFKNFVNSIKLMDKKLDTILNELNRMKEN